MNSNRTFAKSISDFIAERQELESVVNERDTVRQITEVTDKEINALRQLAIDVDKIKKDYLKIVNMGDKELKDKKYNKEYEDILAMQQSIQSLIQKLKDKKILNRESVVNEESLNEMGDWRFVKNPLTYRLGRMTDQGFEKALIDMKKNLMNLKFERDVFFDDSKSPEDIYDEIKDYATKEFNLSLNNIDKFIERRVDARALNRSRNFK